MYVADARGVAIFNSSGGLLSEDTLIFTVLPALFETMGSMGMTLATAFFVLMSIAALTSSISMLEVPVAYLIERHGLTRHRATFLTGACIAAFSSLIVLNFAPVRMGHHISTRYGQPPWAFLICIFAGWVWRETHCSMSSRRMTRRRIGLFWRTWPFYVKWLCPAIGVIVLQSIV